MTTENDFDFGFSFEDEEIVSKPIVATPAPTVSNDQLLALQEKIDSLLDAQEQSLQNAYVTALEEKHKAKLKELLQLHVTETDSMLGKHILDNFETEVANFTRVLPRDYANVLSIREKATSAGIDPDSETVWQEILEVTNG